NEPGQFHRNRHLGRRRRAPHAEQTNHRRLCGQSRQELVYRQLPRILAFLPRPALHRRHPDAAARTGRSVEETAGQERSRRMNALASAFENRPEGSDGTEQMGHRVSGDLDLSHGVALYLEDISVSFDGFKALNQLTLAIDAGELRCIIGPNGAGKTTMMDVITGKTRPDSGKAYFGQSIDLTRLSEPEIAHLGIGRKFQKPIIFEQHTVFENLELAMKTDKRVWKSLLAWLAGEERDRIAETLRLIRLGKEADRPAGLLSHGQKQWLEIGMLLMQEPKLLLLDEPVAGMTDDETMRTAELFVSLAGKHSLV